MAIPHAELGLCLVAGADGSAVLLNPASGERVSMPSTAELHFSASGWGFLHGVSEDGSAVWAKSLINIAVLRDPSRGVYFHDRASKITSWESTMRQTHTSCFPTLSVLSKTFNLTVLRMSCPVDGQQCWWDVKPIQDSALLEHKG
eukprot:971411-Lingulodinium_polyedra.AAC.1